MPVKLELGKQLNEDRKPDVVNKNNNIDNNVAIEPEQKAKASKRTTTAKAKKGQGRPKGDPVVTRSLRIKSDINDRLVKKQKQTGLSFNELANRAFDQYLK